MIINMVFYDVVNPISYKLDVVSLDANVLEVVEPSVPKLNVVEVDVNKFCITKQTFMLRDHMIK